MSFSFNKNTKEKKNNFKMKKPFNLDWFTNPMTFFPRKKLGIFFNTLKIAYFPPTIPILSTLF